MKQLIYFELLKLRQWKVVWSVLLGLIAVNLVYIGFAANRIGADNSRMVEKHEIYQELETMEKEAAMAFLEEKMEGCRLLYEQDWGNPQNRYSAYRAVREELYFAYSHTEWMETTKEQSMQYDNPLFQSEDSGYQRRSAAQTLKVYEKLGMIETRLLYEEPFYFATENPVLEASVLISIFVLVVQLVVHEREKGYLQYIKITKNGKNPFLAVKYLVLAICTIGIVVLFYGSSIAMFSYLMPYDGTLPVQCLQSFVGCPFPVNIYESMGMFVLDRCIVYLLFGVAILAVSNSLNAILKIVMGCMLIFGGQWLLWELVSPFSHMHILHTINLFTIADTKMLMSSYNTWNILDMPVNQMLCIWAIRIFLFLGLFYVTFKTFAEKKEGEYEKSEVLLHRYQKYIGKIESIYKKRGMFTLKSGEWYKLLIRNGGLAVFVAAISVSLVFISQFRVFTDAYRYYMKEYAQILDGTPSKEKEQWIEEQNVYWEMQERELEEQYELVQKGEISQEAYQGLIEIYEMGETKRRALADVSSIYERAVELNEMGDKAEFTLQEVWEAVFGTYGIGNFAKLLCVVLAALILVLSNCGAEEYANGIQTLLQVYKNGKKVRQIKGIYASVYAVLLSLCIFGAYYGRVLGLYEVNAAGLHTKSIYLLNDVFNMPLAAFGMLVSVVLGMIIIVAAQWVIHLSYRLQNRIFTIFVSAATLLLPVIVMYMLIG
uniref:hypothetical protein n=1 Tax=Agathobacter sp. TaxID=2021311 RepID=UPI004055B72A